MSDIRWLVNNWDYFYFVDAPVHLSGVSLDKSSINLTEVWQTKQLTATTTPADAIEDPSVVWSSSDTSIATVDQDWVVTCVTPWECTITVTTVYWWFTATCGVVNATTEWWFFYTDWVYYWDKTTPKETKLSSKAFDYVLYDRKYGVFYWRSWTTYWVINSTFDWFTWTTYTLYDWWSGCVVAKWDYIIFTWKNSSWSSWYRKTIALSRSTHSAIYTSSTASWTYQWGEELYSYIPTEHCYSWYWTWNATTYLVDLANWNTVTSRSFWYSQAGVFNGKVILLTENGSLWIQIRDYSTNSTLASYWSSTWNAWSIHIMDTWIVDNYSSSDPMYWKIAVNWTRNNTSGWAIVDVVNDTITSMTMQSSSWPRWIFVPYNSMSWYTHFCAFWWTGSGWFGVFNSANNTYNKLFTWTGAIRINIMADWSLLWCWGTPTLYDIDTSTTVTHSWLNNYVWKYVYTI